MERAGTPSPKGAGPSVPLPHFAPRPLAFGAAAFVPLRALGSAAGAAPLAFGSGFASDGFFGIARPSPFAPIHAPARMGATVPFSAPARAESTAHGRGPAPVGCRPFPRAGIISKEARPRQY